MSKLKKGWHAYVVYWYKGERRAELTKILKSDPGHLVIRSNYKARDKFRAEGIIPRGNIVVIVAAEKRGDITGWKNANRVIQHLSENARIRFKSPRIASGESKAAWIVGRLFAVNQDTFVVEVGRSGSDIYHVPLSSFADLEVSIGRSGNSLKGLLAGGFIGSTLSGAIAALTGKPDPTSEIPTFGDMAMIVVCFTAIIVPAVIGMNTTTERWADVPLSGLNLSVAPTQERGLRTELSFDI